MHKGVDVDHACYTLIAHTAVMSSSMVHATTTLLLVINFFFKCATYYCHSQASLRHLLQETGHLCWICLTNFTFSGRFSWYPFKGVQANLLVMSCVVMPNGKCSFRYRLFQEHSRIFLIVRKNISKQAHNKLIIWNNNKHYIIRPSYVIRHHIEPAVYLRMRHYIFQL